MWIPVIISFIVSNLFLNGLASQQFNNGITVQENSRFLGLTEQVNHLPINSYNFFHPENYLPKSPDKPVAPEKKADAPDLAVGALACAVMDKKSGEIIYSANADSQRPIASITKLMTVLTLLDYTPDWNKVYKLKKSDIRLGGKSYIYEGDEMTVIHLWHLCLMASDNTATIALISSLGMTEDDFVVKMNAKAQSLGLANSSFTDATGLTDKNVSTAKEIVFLAKDAFKMKIIRDTVLTKNYEFSTLGGRKVKVDPTDLLLNNFPSNGISMMGGKTGHTDEAGYCFASQFSDQTGNEVISAVLGTASDEARFRETKKLVNWVYSNFIWK